MSILAWNCRGISEGASPLVSFISSIASSSNVDVIFLQETKCSVGKLEGIFAVRGYSNCLGWDSVGSKWGLFVCWSPRIAVVVIDVSENIILCKVSTTPNYEFYVAFVYGSPYFENRPRVWDYIHARISNLEKVLLIGDFNQIEDQS